MDEALLKKLQDKNFAAKLLEFGSKEEVKNFLKSEGYEISNEELDHMAETLRGLADTTKDLSDEELEKTAGGVGEEFFIASKADAAGMCLNPNLTGGSFPSGTGAPSGGNGIGKMAIGLGTAGLAGLGAAGAFLYNRFKKKPEPKGMSTGTKVAIGAGSMALVGGLAVGGVWAFKELRKRGWWAK